MSINIIVKNSFNFLILAYLLVFAMPTNAINIVANSSIDAVDVTPGDGVCETGPANGICTLRAAIQETNALAGADTITLPEGTYILEIAGVLEDGAATGDLDITDELNIMGAGSASTIIDGGGLDRVIDNFFNNNTVILNDLTIRNGLANTSLNIAGGGILNRGNLTLNQVTITDNTANVGGGISNRVTLTLNQCTVSNNKVEAFGFTNPFGGGISSQVLTGLVNINNSTISGNDAVGASSGGIEINSTVMMINNSTFSGNSGAGLRNVNGTITLENTTFKDNPTSISNFICAECTGGITLKNSILTNDSGANCSGTTAAITSLGNNLENGSSCSFGETGNLSDTDPLLGPLADNGGPTQTHALLAGSPAINAVSDCPPPDRDQRNITRPQGNACDIGAFEYEHSCLLDIDGNGNSDALTDGLLTLRYEFGFRGSVLTDAIVAANCTRCTAPEIEQYLAACSSTLDVDGSGAPASALTDGLLTLRYEFNFRGETLINELVDENCTRCTAREIEAYLRELEP